MKLVEAMEAWFVDRGVPNALRESINLMEHLTATVEGKSAAGFADMVKLRERRETNRKALAARRALAKQEDEA